MDIGYGGNFFVLADVHSLGLTITKDTVNLLRSLSKDILAAANKVIKVAHPTNPAINYLDRVLFCQNVPEEGRRLSGPVHLRGRARPTSPPHQDRRPPALHSSSGPHRA